MAASPKVMGKGDLLLKVRIPELNIQRIAKISWDMTGQDAVKHICKRHRFETPSSYGLFTLYEDDGLQAATNSPNLDAAHSSTSNLHGDPDRLNVFVRSGQVLVQHVVGEQKARRRDRNQIIYEEEGVLGMFIEDDAELRQYPFIENMTVEMRRKPTFLQVLFANGGWRCDVRYDPDMKLSEAVGFAQGTWREINRVSEMDDPPSAFACSPTATATSSGAGGAADQEDGGWPHTLFFEKKSMWLEETDATLKSKGIEAADVLELKAKPKLVRVYIRDEKSDTSTSKMIKYMPNTTVHMVIEQIKEMRSDGQDADRPSRESGDQEYGLFLSHNRKSYDEGGEGVWLGEDKRLASYHLELTDSLHFLLLPEELRRKQQGGTQADLQSHVLELVVVDIFTDAQVKLFADFDTSVRDVILEFLKKTPSRDKYLSTSGTPGLYIPAHDDCNAMPSATFMNNRLDHTRVQADAGAAENEEDGGQNRGVDIFSLLESDTNRHEKALEPRCSHGRWLPDGYFICFAGLCPKDVIEVRFRELMELSPGSGMGRGGDENGILHQLGLHYDLEERADAFQDEENTAMRVVGMWVEVYVAPPRALTVAAQWERLWVKVGSLTTGKGVKMEVLFKSGNGGCLYPDALKYYNLHVNDPSVWNGELVDVAHLRGLTKVGENEVIHPAILEKPDMSLLFLPRG
eukprot:CAMPEP_0119126568 /NCGR_PEP_ID=MMETSP1310-20130426/5449_1 /TAXON_ID=464262 /ORGANISM="Genus nov. species nov., Strain RCC2339" /LENGTH=686 /DNA_ID=CAMNT_0007116735 /DNA_START=76 /DNA_END=2132 /DNA_ORIENTATION=+